jgi:uncharacterized damage-inducible protein DinB
VKNLMTDQAQRQTQLDMAREQIIFTRDNTNLVLSDISPDRWYEQPVEGVNHVAWQVGHIAMAQYGLALLRQRGRQPLDRELMPKPFMRAFAKDSTPASSAEDALAVADILDVFNRVHSQVLKELESYPLEQLGEEVEPPYVGQATRLGALLMSAHHEMLHAGQIGMMRRLLGLAPLVR